MNQLKYFLKDNALTPDPTDFYGSVQHGKAVDDEELIEMIVYRSTGVSRSDVVRILEELKVVLRFFLANGRSLNTSLINALYSITGVFISEEDRFDSSRHTLNLNLKPGLGLQGLTEQITMVKVPAPATEPTVNTFMDTETGTRNQQLTPGAPGKLIGKKLKFNAQDPLHGVFFIHETSGKAIQVDKFVECAPSKLIFMIPKGMAKGNYYVEVRKGTDKAGRLSTTLQVV